MHAQLYGDLLKGYKCDRYTPSGLAIATRQELNEKETV